MIVIQSPRLQLSIIQMKDAQEGFGCITPAIAKFMPWEPPARGEYVTRSERRVQAPEANKFSFVIRRLDNAECLGMASFEDADHSNRRERAFHRYLNYANCRLSVRGGVAELGHAGSD